MGWDSKFIEWGTNSWCSHAEFFVRSYDPIWKDFGMSTSMANRNVDQTFGAQLRGGVMFRKTTFPCYNNMKRWDLWNIPCTVEQAEKVVAFCRTTIWKPYDWRAIINMGLQDRDWRSPDSWFCSEQNMAALEAGDLAHIPANEPVNRITPIMLETIIAQIPGAEVVQSWKA
jgi:hypothetical protein